MSERIGDMRNPAPGSHRRVVVVLAGLGSHGRQPGSEWNGHFNGTAHHPLVASSGKTADLLDAPSAGGPDPYGCGRDGVRAKRCWT